MKYFFISILLKIFFVSPLPVLSQEENFPITLKEEEMAETDENDEEEQEQLHQQLFWFRKHPLNINDASTEQLNSLGLSIHQVNALVRHIKLFGNLISVYELQAVALFDINSIYRILPYIYVADRQITREKLKSALKNGKHFAIFRSGQILERAKGYAETNSTDKRYGGSRQKIFVRYQFRSANKLQMGFTGEKDAGEKFFRGERKNGFDFYSGHFFIQKPGFIHAIALGDYKVQFGQGLIQWQGFSIGKGNDGLGVKRQGPVLQSYTATGEFNFYRGAAITLARKKWQLISFLSTRRLNASLDTNELIGRSVTSLLTSGLNRTSSELYRRKILTHNAFGASMKYNFHNGHFAVNHIRHHFSLPIAKKDVAYAAFDFTGNDLSSTSMDYAYTLNNIHFFGEVAADKDFHWALINGLMVSMDAKADLVMLYRRFDKSYQSLFASAFGAQSFPKNESGIYIGSSWRPSKEWQLNISADLAAFSWLRFQSDAPGFQKDFSVTLRYTPNKNLEYYTRFRAQSKIQNELISGAYNQLSQFTKIGWRTQVSYKIKPELTLRQRLEFCWYGKINTQPESGFLFYSEAFYKPYSKDYSVTVRCQFFEVTDYSARIYAYEQDVLLNSSTTAFDGTGWRYYIIMQRKFRSVFEKSTSKNNIHGYIRWSQTIYPGIESISSGLDQIRGPKKTELKLQLVIFFG